MSEEDDPLEKLLVNEVAIETTANALDGLINLQAESYEILPTEVFYKQPDNVQVFAYCLATAAAESLENDILRAEPVCTDNEIVGDAVKTVVGNNLRKHLKSYYRTEAKANKTCIQITDVLEIARWVIKNRQVNSV